MVNVRPILLSLIIIIIIIIIINMSHGYNEGA